MPFIATKNMCAESMLPHEPLPGSCISLETVSVEIHELLLLSSSFGDTDTTTINVGRTPIHKQADIRSLQYVAMLNCPDNTIQMDLSYQNN